MTNIITAAVTALQTVKTLPAWQYDYGQILKLEGVDLPEAYEVHFANYAESGTTITQIGDADGVTIPDELFQTGLPIFAWLYIHTGEDDGETVYRVLIPVRKRAEPSDDEPTPVEQSAITQAIAALNLAVTETAADAAAASDSADDASQSALDSEAWAVGQRNGVDVGSDDATYRNNSKWYAELAEQHAESAGYAFFDVDDSTGQLMVTVTDSLAEDVSFAVNETTGILEVTIE